MVKKMEKAQNTISSKATEFFKKAVLLIEKKMSKIKGWKPDDKNPGILFDRIFCPHFRVHIRVSIGDELWYQTLANGNRVIQLLSIDSEYEKENPKLKIHTITIFYLKFGFCVI